MSPPASIRSVAHVIAIALITSVICTAVWLDKLPLGIEGEWTWQNMRKGSFWETGWLTVSILMGYVCFVSLLSGWAHYRSRLVRFVLVLSLVPAAFGIQYVVQLAPRVPYDLNTKWVFSLYFPGSSGYYSIARRVYNVPKLMENYPEFLRQQDPFHLGTHPPGLILAQYAALNLCESSEVSEWVRRLEPATSKAAFQQIGQNEPGAVVRPGDEAAIWLIALLRQLSVALAVIPIYLLLRSSFDESTSLLAAAFWPLVPSVTLFVPKSDVMYPLVSVLFCCLILIPQRRWPKIISAAAAGALFWVGLLFTLAFLTILPLAGLTLLIDHWRRDSGAAAALKDLAARFGVLAAVFAMLTMGAFIMFRLDLPTTWYLCYIKHQSFYDLMSRSYWPWVGWNLAEFFVGMGIPLAYGAFCLLGAPPIGDRWRLCHSLIYGWFATIMVLNFSGKNLSEVARLWILLIPFALAGLAYLLDQKRRWVILALLFIQGIQAIVMASCIQVFIDAQSVSLPD